MRVVQMIGHVGEEGPRRLAKMLVDHQYVVSNMPDPSTEMMLLCISHPGLDAKTWKTIEENPQARVIPAVFNEGPILPARYADIRGIDFSGEFENEFSELTKAINRLVQDR